MNEQKKKYYHSFSKLNYWNALCDVCQSDVRVEYQELNKIIEKQYRADFYAYVLWDILFFGNQEEFPYSDSVFFGGNENRTRRIENVISTLKYPEVRKIIDDIAYRWEVFRNHFYWTDKVQLDGCKKIEDYEIFIKNHPQTYGEYLLYAEFEKSRLEHKPFSKFSDLNNRYPNSPLLGKLSKKLRNLNGVQYFLSEEIENEEDLTNALLEFLRGFKPFKPDSSDFEPELSSKPSLYSSPITEDLYNMVNGYNLNKNNVMGVNKCKTRYACASFNDCNSVVKKISELLSINISVPTIKQMERIYLQHEKFSPESDVLQTNEMWEWVRAPNDRGGNVTSFLLLNNDKELSAYSVEKYALCRVVISN